MNTTPLAPDNAAWQARISAGLEETHSAEQSAGDQAMSLVNIAKVKYIPDFERSIQAGDSTRHWSLWSLGWSIFGRLWRC